MDAAVFALIGIVAIVAGEHRLGFAIIVAAMIYDLAKRYIDKDKRLVIKDDAKNKLIEGPNPSDLDETNKD